MPYFAKARSFFRNLFLARRVEAELDEEVRAHLEMLVEEKVRAGMISAEARREARMELGGVDQVKEQVRERQLGIWMQLVFADCRYGVRQLWKNPGFTAVAVITLALGIGANTAIFSIVDAILLRQLPYAEPSRLVRIWESSVKFDSPRNVVNPLNFLDWRDHAESFESMAAISNLTTNLIVQGQPIAVQGMQVTPDFFAALRVTPLLGRTFNAADGVPGQDRNVILSYGLWQERFGGARDAVGQKLDVDGSPYLVVGVMPKQFSFPGIKPEVWTPMALSRADQTEGGRFLTVVARLKQGISIERAQQDMLRIVNYTQQARPDYNRNWSANVVPMLEDTTEGVRRPIWVLFVSVGFLLLIACANVANLSLMRGTARVRELAVRSALGASRSQIIRQLFVESVVLAFLGMGAGLLVGNLALSGLLALIPRNAPLPRSEPISIDARVLVFTMIAAVFTAVLSGLIPAMRLSLVDLQNALKQGTLRAGVGGHQTLRRTFVVVEVALAVVLSVGAGLMLRSFKRLVTVDPGFDREHILAVPIWMSPAIYFDDLKRSQHIERILDEIRSTTGVRSAGSVHFLPLTDKSSGSCFSPAEQPPPTPAESPSAQFLIVSPGYFKTMGTALLSGRDFDESDNFGGRPVAIVNSAFVNRYFPGQAVLGKQLRVCWTIEKPVDVVGLVADARQEKLRDAPEPTIFLSNSQAPMYFATLVVRVQGDPRQSTRSVEAAIHKADPAQAISKMQTMDGVFSDSVSGTRFQSTLLLVFAGLAVALAVVGVYGVISYNVAQRTNELGIRAALGADAGEIARLILREVFTLVLIALMVGVTGSLALGRALASLLYDVAPTDPFTFGLVACVVLAVSISAAALPTARAMRTNPLTALRCD